MASLSKPTTTLDFLPWSPSIFFWPRTIVYKLARKKTKKQMKVATKLHQSIPAQSHRKKGTNNSWRKHTNTNSNKLHNIQQTSQQFSLFQSLRFQKPNTTIRWNCFVKLKNQQSKTLALTFLWFWGLSTTSISYKKTNPFLILYYSYFAFDLFADLISYLICQFAQKCRNHKKLQLFCLWGRGQKIFWRVSLSIQTDWASHGHDFK